MFEKKGENKNIEEETVLKSGAMKNKEVIAEYDEVLSSENEQKDGYLGKLELLKQRLGLGSDSENSPSSIKTNLIDNDDVATFIDWKSSLSLFTSYFLILLVLISGALAYLTFIEKEKNREFSIYDEDIQKTKETIEREESYIEEGLLFQKKIEALSVMIDKHVYWSELFAYLEKNTLKSVYFDNFSGGLDGKYSLDASADEKYFVAVEQFRALKEDELTKKVDFEKLSLEVEKDGGVVKFNLNMIINPDIFYKEE